MKTPYFTVMPLKTLGVCLPGFHVIAGHDIFPDSREINQDENSIT
jgi:hypothetical protein